MLQDGLTFADGSQAINFQIANGASLPSTGNNIGELFFLTTGKHAGLYVYNGSAWESAEGGGLAVEHGTSDPATGEEGQLYWRSDLLKLKYYDGSGWYEVVPAPSNIPATALIGTASTTGQILTSTGPTSAPTWQAAASSSAGSATNIAGGAAGQIPYQTAAGTTTFSPGISFVAQPANLTNIFAFGNSGQNQIRTTAASSGLSFYTATPTTNASAGDVTFFPGGAGPGTNAGGAFLVAAGDGGTSGGSAGGISLTAGNSPAVSGAPGTITIKSGNGTGSNTTGGAINIGTGTGTTAHGSIIFSTGGTRRISISGTGALGFGAAGTTGSAGQVLTSDGNGIATWATPATPSGSLPSGLSYTSTVFTIGTGATATVTTAAIGAGLILRTPDSSNGSTALVSIRGGDNNSGTGSAAPISIQAGSLASSNTTASAGGIQIFAGNHLNASSQTGGSVAIAAGYGSRGGNINISAGAATNSLGGHVYLAGGTANNRTGGSAGNIYLGGLSTDGAGGTSGGTGTSIIANIGSGFEPGAFVIQNGGTERLRILASGALSFGSGGTGYGSAGQVLTSNGSAAPSWQTASAGTTTSATSATNIAGGAANQIPFQSAAGATTFSSNLTWDNNSAMTVLKLGAATATTLGYQNFAVVTSTANLSIMGAPAASASSNGFGVYLSGSSGGTTSGSGGVVSMSGGAGYGTGNAGGVSLNGGNSVGTGQGGHIVITAGNNANGSAGSGALPGNVTITGGNDGGGSFGGSAGNVTLQGGTQNGNNAVFYGGNVILAGGLKSGATGNLATPGQVIIKTADIVRVSVSPTGVANFTGLIQAANSVTVTGGRVIKKVSTPAYAASVAIDASLGDVWHVGVLTGNVSLSVTNPVAGQEITVRVKQDSTGGRTVTLPAAWKIVDSAGSAANQASLLKIEYVDADARYEGRWIALPV